VVFVLAMFGHRLGWMEASTQSWVELALDSGRRVGGLAVLRTLHPLVHQSQPEHVDAHRTWYGTAYVYSVIATVVPGVFPEAFAAHGRVSVYFEAAAVIISLTSGNCSN
jgi:Cu+-exporting ATPase